MSKSIKSQAETLIQQAEVAHPVSKYTGIATNQASYNQVVSIIRTAFDTVVEGVKALYDNAIALKKQELQQANDAINTTTGASIVKQTYDTAIQKAEDDKGRALQAAQEHYNAMTATLPPPATGKLSFLKNLSIALIIEIIILLCIGFAEAQTNVGAIWSLGIPSGFQTNLMLGILALIMAALQHFAGMSLNTYLVEKDKKQLRIALLTTLIGVVINTSMAAMRAIYLSKPQLDATGNVIGNAEQGFLHHFLPNFGISTGLLLGGIALAFMVCKYFKKQTADDFRKTLQTAKTNAQKAYDDAVKKAQDEYSTAMDTINTTINADPTALAKSNGADIKAIETTKAAIETLQTERSEMLDAVQTAFNTVCTDLATAVSKANNTTVSYSMMKIIPMLLLFIASFMTSCTSDDPSRYQQGGATAATTADGFIHKDVCIIVDATSKLDKLPITTNDIATYLGIPLEECHKYSINLAIGTISDVSMNVVKPHKWYPKGAGYENPLMAKQKYQPFWSSIKADLEALQAQLQTTDKPSSSIYRGLCQILQQDSIPTNATIIFISDMIENSDIANLYRDDNPPKPTDEWATKLTNYTNVVVIYAPKDAREQALFDRAMRWWKGVIPVITARANL